MFYNYSSIVCIGGCFCFLLVSGILHQHRSIPTCSVPMRARKYHNDTVNYRYLLSILTQTQAKCCTNLINVVNPICHWHKLMVANIISIIFEVVDESDRSAKTAYKYLLK